MGAALPRLPEIAIGEMRRRVTIRQKQVTRSSSGEEVIVWQDFKTVWASLEPLSGRELYAAREVYPEADTRISIRYLRGLDPSMAIFWTDPRTNQLRQYDIIQISDVLEQSHQMTITAVERPPQRNVGE